MNELDRSVKLDGKGRAQANALIEAVMDDPEQAAFEIVALRAEVEWLGKIVREWMCDACNSVFPGPPQEGARCVICPLCGGDTAPVLVIRNVRLQREVEAREERIVRLQTDLDRALEALRDARAEQDELRGVVAELGSHKYSRQKP